MDAFVRSLVVYLFLLVILRLAGKRTLSEMSTFDFILLLIISEATQNALLDEDRSLSTGLAVILSLVTLDRVAAFLKTKFSSVEKIMEGTPLVLVDNGRVLDECLRKAQVSVDDILQAARQTQGLARMDQIKYAVIEASGGISIIPKEDPHGLEQRIEAAVARALEKAGKGA